MPRDNISKIYSPPADTHGIPDEVIESAKYNAWADDLKSVLSDALPIEMGGTGEDNVEDALTNLGAISKFYLSNLLAGMIGFFAGATVPSDWLLCNGQAVSRTQYFRLFQRIGTVFGAGNSNSTFNVPDLRGEFIRSLDKGRGVDAGRTIGSAQAAENKGHDHAGSTSSAGAHVHGVARFVLIPGNQIIAFYTGTLPGFNQNLGGGTTTSAGAHTHDVTLDSTGGEFRPRNVTLLPCIKT